MELVTAAGASTPGSSSRSSPAAIEANLMPSPDSLDFALDELPGASLHEALDVFRARAPVAPTRFFGQPAFVISSYETLLEAFADNERFPPHRMYQASFEPAIGESFISMPEPDRHRTYRKLATPAFRSRAVARVEREGLAAIAHALIDDLEGRSRVDLMADFAARFPYLVITRMLGLPRDREADFHRWALALLRFREEPEPAQAAAEEFTRHLAPIVAARRAEPRDDVISELVAARVDGRGLTDEEVFAHVRLLFPTGGETTHGALGNALYALLTDPEGWRRLCSDPARIPAVVEEALRWETPIAVLPRLSASRPVEFRGASIPPDTWVLFAIAGANHDPAMHPDPHRFDPDRAPNDRLTFGRGVKSCPGMHLAKRNMAVALEALAARLPELALIDAEKAVPRRSVLRCPEALEVRIGAR
jgi:cytochrome P450